MTPASEDEPAALAAELEARHRRGAERWPTVEVPLAAFDSYVRERLGDGDDPLRAIHTNDLYLACACVIEAPNASRTLEEHIMSALPQVIRRTDRSPDFVDEVMSRVRVKLLVGTDSGSARIGQYLGHGPLRSFAMVLAMREAHNYARSLRRSEPLELIDWTDLADPATNPEVKELRRKARSPLAAAVREAIRGLSARDRTILRLYYVNGASSTKIGKMYGVHRGTVARWIANARAQLLETAQTQVCEELNLEVDTFQDVLRDFTGGFDITLATVLDGEER
ncbi:MAG: sigma-70 family RNA polymerase sigma factor [Myxococcota bacterium]